MSETKEWGVVRATWCGYLDSRLSPQKKVGDITHSTSMIYACKPCYRIKDFLPAVTDDLELKKKVEKKWANLLGYILYTYRISFGAATTYRRVIRERTLEREASLWATNKRVPWSGVS
jgi:hypothetical protein